MSSDSSQIRNPFRLTGPLKAAIAFTELNEGNALLQSTALPLAAVPGVDPDTVTLRPEVGTAKLVDPLPMTIEA